MKRSIVYLHWIESDGKYVVSLSRRVRGEQERRRRRTVLLSTKKTVIITIALEGNIMQMNKKIKHKFPAMNIDEHALKSSKLVKVSLL